MFGWRKRIGYIAPTVIEVVAYEFYRFAPDGIGLTGVTCGIDDWRPAEFEKGLAQVSDTGAIEKFCDEAIAANPGPANDFKAGKVAALNFLKGQVMKLSKGKANPALVGEILERKLR